MKQKTITIGKETFLFQQLPGDAENVTLHYWDNTAHVIYTLPGVPDEQRISTGIHKQYGAKLLFTFSLDSTPTEEQAGEVVEKDGEFKDYCFWKDYTSKNPFAKATESFPSLLTANEILLENKYGKEEPKTYPFEYYQNKYCPNGAESEYRFDREMQKLWQSAEEKVWRGKVAILKLNK